VEDNSAMICFKYRIVCIQLQHGAHRQWP